MIREPNENQIHLLTSDEKSQNFSENGSLQRRNDPAHLSEEYFDRYFVQIELLLLFSAALRSECSESMHAKKQGDSISR
jgi:hypothetical protein